VLIWGVKESFRNYVKGSGGTIDVASPARSEADRFAFPFAGSVDGELRYAGEVRFAAHGGMLSVAIIDPWIVFGPEEAALTVVDTDYLPDRSRRLPIARIDTREPRAGASVEAAVALTVQGSRLLGDVYAPHTALDPVVFAIPAEGSP